MYLNPQCITGWTDAMMKGKDDRTAVIPVMHHCLVMMQLSVVPRDNTAHSITMQLLWATL